MIISQHFSHGPRHFFRRRKCSVAVSKGLPGWHGRNGLDPLHKANDFGLHRIRFTKAARSCKTACKTRFFCSYTFVIIRKGSRQSVSLPHARLRLPLKGQRPNRQMAGLQEHFGRCHSGGGCFRPKSASGKVVGSRKATDVCTY